MLNYLNINYFFRVRGDIMLITIISLSVPKAISKHIIHHFHRALICAVGMVYLIRRWWVLFTNRMIVILLKYDNKQHNVYLYTLLNSNRLNVISLALGCKNEKKKMKKNY